jgi:GWxTD domain-containing protein
MLGFRTRLAALLLAAPTGALAQEPALMRDSIDALADTAALRRMALSATAPGTAFDQLRRGFAFLRLYEVAGAREDAERARAAFERARHLAPGDVYAALGLGLSLAVVANAEDADPPTFVTGRALAEVLGRDARARARRALERALALEPALADAATALADVALRTRDRAALLAARSALQRSTDGGHASSAVWRARAGVELALGDAPAAVDAAESARSLGDRTVATEHLLAQALLRTEGRESEGANAYFRAARRASASGAAPFADELNELWNDGERAGWSALDAAGRAAFLERFWNVRAALAGTTVAERLAEHQRRMAVAFERYRRKTRWGAPPSNALLLERRDGRFDDRGVIFVRHGEPADVVRTLGRDVPPNESWLYHDAAGEPRLLHFLEYGSVIGPPGGGLAAARGGYADYVLVYELPCAPDWVADRVAYDHRLNPLLRSCSTFDRKSISIEVRRDAYAALATDSHAPPFARDLLADHALYAFRGLGGTVHLLAAAAAPAAILEAPEAATAPAARGLALAIVAADTAAGEVTRADTVMWSLEDTVVAHASITVAAHSGTVLRIVLRDAADPGHGWLRGRALEVPPLAAGALALSDIVLAAPATPDEDDPAAWRRGEAALSLVPGSTFAEADFRVFFEVYGLEPDAHYSTVIHVEPRDRGIGGALRRLFRGTPPLRLRFDDVAAADADAAVRVLRDVHADLPAGSWTLVVEVADARGRSARQERGFVIPDHH